VNALVGYQVLVKVNNYNLMAKRSIILPETDQQWIENIDPLLSDFSKNIGGLFGDINKACKYVKVEERKNKKLLDQNYERLGKIITCHLVIEHFINRELELLHNIDYDKRKDARLTFFNKVELLPKKGKVYSQLLKGIKQINSTRNMFAHNLNYEVSSSRISEINKWVEKIPGVIITDLTIIERIEKFTQLCIFFFSFRSDTSLKQFEVLANKYPHIPFFKLLIKK
jgi:hypothetical protein